MINVSRILSHCSNDCKNILLVIENQNCSFAKLLERLDLDAELNLSLIKINYQINARNLPAEVTLKPDVLQCILDVYTELLNNIIKHSAAENVDITVHYHNGIIELLVRDDGIGLDESIEKISDSYGMDIMNKLAGEMNAGFNLTGSPGEGALAKPRIKKCRREVIVLPRQVCQSRLPPQYKPVTAVYRRKFFAG